MKHGLVSGCIAATLLTGCAGPQRSNDVAQSLDLDSKTTRRYHYLADVPFAESLTHSGYIVALEKSPRARVSYRAEQSYAQRFRMPAAGQANAQLRAHLARTIHDNEKAFFVSHIVAYEADDAESARDDNRASGPASGMRTRFVYNIYADRGAQTYGASAGVPLVEARDPYHEHGWQALERSLYRDLHTRLTIAREGGRPYTHLIFAAMGWDNDQPESIRRYNAIVGQMVERSRRDTTADLAFNPLIIGITWPSVWGWQSWFDIRQLGYKLIGYANKSDDADEIGYTYANWLVNRLGLDMRAAFADTGLRVIVLGHSFGARIMSRAVFSRTLLREPADSDQTVDLLAGLQGAFSVNRFIPGAGNEGYPYAGMPGMHGLVLMTTSEHDSANPLAYYLSRALHIGGRRGLAKARAPEHASYFHVTRGMRIEPEACGAGRVLLVDASDYVYHHNDVLGPEIGALLWSAARCAARTDRSMPRRAASQPAQGRPLAEPAGAAADATRTAARRDDGDRALASIR